MEFDSIRPAVSGVIGGILATWLTSRWARNLPSYYQGWSRAYLLRRHRPAIWTANALFFIGLCFGIALYPLVGFENTDWRPLLLGFGLASVLPLLALAIVSLLSGRNVNKPMLHSRLVKAAPYGRPKGFSVRVPWRFSLHWPASMADQTHHVQASR